VRARYHGNSSQAKASERRQNATKHAKQQPHPIRNKQWCETTNRKRAVPCSFAWPFSLRLASSLRRRRRFPSPRKLERQRIQNCCPPYVRTECTLAVNWILQYYYRIGRRAVQIRAKYAKSGPSEATTEETTVVGQGTTGSQCSFARSCRTSCACVCFILYCIPLLSEASQPARQHQCEGAKQRHP